MANLRLSVINKDGLHVDAQEHTAHAAARRIMLVGVQTLSNSWMRAFLLSLAILTPAVPTLQDPHDEERKKAEMVRERREEGRGEWKRTVNKRKGKESKGREEEKTTKWNQCRKKENEIKKQDEDKRREWSKREKEGSITLWSFPLFRRRPFASWLTRCCVTQRADGTGSAVCPPLN